MTRRDLAHLMFRALALPASAPFFSEWLAAGQNPHHAHGASAPPEPPFLENYQPKFFGKEDFEALQSFTTILIPTDETPGAHEACCAQFIDFVLDASGNYAPGVQKQWRVAMASLKEAGFHTADASGRATLVEAISRPEHDPSAQHPAFAAYRLIKRENAFAFYTSRAGSIEALDYRGNTYNLVFPACTHPEHHVV